MDQSGIRVLTLAVCAAVLASVVATSGAEASSRHTKKHHHRMIHPYGTSFGFNEAGTARTIAPVAAPSVGDVCPGNRRSFECSVWPPPFDQDPDRRTSGSDAGG
jgi:hypothetical protein